MSKSNVYVGIDLHKRIFNFVMMRGNGKVITEGKRTTDAEDVINFAMSLNKNHHVVLEPIGNSFWFIDQLKPYAGSVHLANSHKVRLIAESRLKNDRIDARILAELLRVGFLPEVYIPSDEIRQWRSIVNHRLALVRHRTRLKNQTLAAINREGFKVELSDAFGKKGRMIIDSLELSSCGRRIVDRYLTNIDYFTLQINDVDKEIEEIGDNDETIGYLMTIDGISYFTGLAIRAFVGDMSRFKGPKSFAAYTGLIPGYRQSADKVRNTSITKQGNSILRWVLIQAVPHAVRKCGYLHRMYYRLLYRSSVGEAKVAVAHALSRMIYHVWTEARPYYR